MTPKSALWLRARWKVPNHVEGCPCDRPTKSSHSWRFFAWVYQAHHCFSLRNKENHSTAYLLLGLKVGQLIFNGRRNGLWGRYALTWCVLRSQGLDETSLKIKFSNSNILLSSLKFTSNLSVPETSWRWASPDFATWVKVVLWWWRTLDHHQVQVIVHMLS